MGVGRRGAGGGGHELFHLRCRGALTSAYRDANQNLKPLPRQVGLVAAQPVCRRKESTKWNFQKRSKTKVLALAVRLRKQITRAWKDFKVHAFRCSSHGRQQRARAFLLASPANVSLSCDTENCCLCVFHTQVR